MLRYILKWLEERGQSTTTLAFFAEFMDAMHTLVFNHSSESKSSIEIAQALHEVKLQFREKLGIDPGVDETDKRKYLPKSELPIRSSSGHDGHRTPDPGQPDPDPH